MSTVIPKPILCLVWDGVIVDSPPVDLLESFLPGLVTGEPCILDDATDPPLTVVDWLNAHSSSFHIIIVSARLGYVDHRETVFDRMDDWMSFHGYNNRLVKYNINKDSFTDFPPGTLFVSESLIPGATIIREIEDLQYFLVYTLRDKLSS